MAWNLIQKRIYAGCSALKEQPLSAAALHYLQLEFQTLVETTMPVKKS
jgi:hypothetical protein